MAYPNPSPHLRITFSGTLGATTPQEIWSCGISAAGGIGSGPWLAQSVESFETLAAAIAAKAEVMLLSCSSTVVLTRTRVAAIGMDGKTMRTPEGAYAQGDSFLTFTGGQTHPGHTAQTALAVTLRSAFAGVTGRGRYFLPVPGFATSGNDLRLSEGNRDTVAAQQKQFLDQVNVVLAANDASLRIGIASGGSLLKGLDPTFHEVIEVGVGRVLDTMRTRRNALAEMNEYAALA